MSDLMRAVDEILEYADDYRLAEDYYFGRVGEVFASNSAISRRIAQSSGRYIVNLARRPVDAVLDRMKITSVSVPGDDKGTDVLNEKVWKANRLDRYEKVAHRAALMYGDAYIFVWPGDDEDDVTIFYNSPITMRLFYDEENPHKKRYAAKVWEEGKSLRVNLYYADRVEKYITRKGSASPKSDTDFMEYVDNEGDAWPIENPYGEVPVFHLRTDEPYGHPEHADAFGPQNAITKLTATQMDTTDFVGYPQRYKLTKPGSGGSASDDQVNWDDEDETQAPDLNDSEVEAGPSTVWNLTGDEVGQLQAADPKLFLDAVGVYTRLMATATATPLRFFDPQGQIPSGEALRADEAPLAAKIEDRQNWLAPDWSDALAFAMRITGLDVDTVEVKWKPVKVVDDKDGWETVKLKQEAGVPRHVALIEAGYASDEVDEWNLHTMTVEGVQP